MRSWTLLSSMLFSFSLFAFSCGGSDPEGDASGSGGGTGGTDGGGGTGNSGGLGGMSIGGAAGAGAAGAAGMAGFAGASGAAGAAGGAGDAGLGGSAGSSGDASVGGAGGGDAGPDAGTSDPPALYPVNGRNWGSWIVATGSAVTSGTDTACAASMASACSTSTELGPGAAICHHAGELRAFTLPFSSCAGVTISDALGAFDWICDSTTGVRALSTGLKPGKHLSDLIDFAAVPTWRTNSITAQQALSSHTTPTAAWWDNPIVVDNDGGSLANPGSVYVVTQNAAALYTLGAHNVSFVTAPGVSLLGTGANGDVVSASSRNFLWFELNIDAAADARGISSNAQFQVIDNTWVKNATGMGITLSTANSLRMRDVVVTDNGSHGLNVAGVCGSVENVTAEGNQTGVQASTRHFVLRDLRTANNADHGLASGGTGDSYNLVDGLVSDNNTNDGLTLSGNRNAAFDVYASSNRHNLAIAGQRNLVAGFSAFNARMHGVNAAGGNHNVILSGVVSNSGSATGSGVLGGSSNVWLAITAQNSQQRGLDIGGNSTVMNAAAVNSGSQGLYSLSANYLTWLNVAATDSSGLDVNMSGAYGITFSGVMRITNNTKCAVTTAGGGNAGITNTCSMTGGSDALVTFTSVASALAGAATSDSVNLSDVSGVAPYDSITDFTGFEAFERGWGIQPVPGPLANSQGACIAGDTCRIWDARVASSDVSGLLRNAVVAPTSGNQTHTQRWSYTTQANCSGIPGASWNAATSTCTSTFLRNAMELLRDGTGNENGLCESNETCIVLRNIGGYQGHGALVPVGTISSGGAISNVALVAYANNGV